jgi:hypothetical protein
VTDAISVVTVRAWGVGIGEFGDKGDKGDKGPLISDLLRTTEYILSSTDIRSTQ